VFDKLFDCGAGGGGERPKKKVFCVAIERITLILQALLERKLIV
jgi:hypothetical protein